MNVSNSQRFLHETNDSISYREDWLLPSDRINYIKNHQVTIMADLHTNPKMLPPLWTKISKTAWEDKARLISGYGVKMQRSKLSEDAPEYFPNATKTFGHLKLTRPGFETYQNNNNNNNHMEDTPSNSQKSQRSLSSSSSSTHLRPTTSFPSRRKEQIEAAASVLPGGRHLLQTTLNFQHMRSRDRFRSFPHSDHRMYFETVIEEKKPPPIKWDYSARSAPPLSSDRRPTTAK